MRKIEIQGDVGQIFTGDVQQVHIHTPSHAPPAFRGLMLAAMWFAIAFGGVGWLYAISLGG